MLVPFFFFSPMPPNAQTNDPDMDEDGEEQISTELTSLPDREEIEKRKQEIQSSREDPEEAEALALVQLSRGKGFGRQVPASSIVDRPSNTTRTYEPAKRAFRKWCEESGFSDDEISEPRALRFLNEVFLEKPEKEGTPYKSYNTLVTYVSGLVDLYKQQKMAGQISPGNSGIRGNGLTAVQEFMDSYPHREAEVGRRKSIRNHSEKESKDCSSNGLDEEYSPKEFAYLMEKALQSENVLALQERLRLQLRHNLLFSGSGTRRMELRDMSVRGQKTEDPTPFTMLSILSKTAKSNQTNHVGAIRHADPKLCILNAAARLLFYRFQMTGEGYPDFSSQDKWYNVKLLVPCLKSARWDSRKKELVLGGLPRSRTWEVGSLTQNRWAELVYQDTTVDRKLNRSSGVWLGAQAGVDIDDGGRQGQSKSTKHYLYGFLHTMLRVQAGFKPDVGHYYVPRATVDPPEDLLQQVFPGVEAMLSEQLVRQWRNHKAEKTPEQQEFAEEYQRSEMVDDLHSEDMDRVISLANLEKDRFLRDNPEPITKGPDTDERAIGFLKLLLHLRRVLLQDMAIQCELYPNDPLLLHPVFQSESFETFAIKVRAAQDEPPPISAKMAVVLPEFCKQIEGLKKSVSAVVQQQRDLQKEFQDKLDACESRINQKLSIGFQRQREDASELKTECAKYLRDSISQSMMLFKDQIVADVNRKLINSLIDVNTSQNERKRKRDGQSDVSTLKKSRTILIEVPPEEFKMQRNNDSIFHLWDEWKNNVPCVEYMERKYGSKWRNNAGDTRFYARRKIIIDAVEEAMRYENKTAEEVLREAHQFQNILPKPTLQQLSVVILQNRIRPGRGDSYNNPFKRHLPE